MPVKVQSAVALLAWLLVAGPALAQEESKSESAAEASVGDVAEEDDADDAEVGAQAARRNIEPIVRGAFVEMRIGAGYMVLNDELPASAREDFPAATGDEGYGLGPYVAISAGYDIMDFFALQAIAGAAFASGTRPANEWVRSLGMYYGGAGARFTFNLGERLKMTADAGAAYLVAANGVEASQGGPAVIANAGIEYYLHVRHFSVGIVATGLIPLTPVRIFAGLAPQLKYTF